MPTTTLTRVAFRASIPGTAAMNAPRVYPCRLGRRIGFGTPGALEATTLLAAASQVTAHRVGVGQHAATTRAIHSVTGLDATNGPDVPREFTGARKTPSLVTRHPGAIVRWLAAVRIANVPKQETPRSKDFRALFARKTKRTVAQSASCHPSHRPGHCRPYSCRSRLRRQRWWHRCGTHTTATRSRTRTPDRYPVHVRPRWRSGHADGRPTCARHAVTGLSGSPAIMRNSSGSDRARGGNRTDRDGRGGGRHGGGATRQGRNRRSPATITIIATGTSIAAPTTASSAPTNTASHTVLDSAEATTPPSTAAAAAVRAATIMITVKPVPAAVLPAAPLCPIPPCNPVAVASTEMTATTITAKSRHAVHPARQEGQPHSAVTPTTVVPAAAAVVAFEPTRVPATPRRGGRRRVSQRKFPPGAVPSGALHAPGHEATPCARGIP